MSKAAHILVVEDDRRTAELIALYLRHAGHKVEVVNDGALALKRARVGGFDLLVLDRMLPGMEGLELVRQLREGSTVPVMMVTARTLEEERIEGLNRGADDYITKPFSPRELVARANALLRRTPPGDSRIVAVGDMTIDPDVPSVKILGVPVDLTPSEFAILYCLAARPGVVRSRMTLVDELPGESGETLERTVDVHVGNIRKKLRTVDPEEVVTITTVFARGYRLDLS